MRTPGSSAQGATISFGKFRKAFKAQPPCTSLPAESVRSAFSRLERRRLKAQRYRAAGQEPRSAPKWRTAARASNPFGDQEIVIPFQMPTSSAPLANRRRKGLRHCRIRRLGVRLGSLPFDRALSALPPESARPLRSRCPKPNWQTARGARNRLRKGAFSPPRLQAISSVAHSQRVAAQPTDAAVGSQQDGLQVASAGPREGPVFDYVGGAAIRRDDKPKHRVGFCTQRNLPFTDGRARRRNTIFCQMPRFKHINRIAARIGGEIDCAVRRTHPPSNFGGRPSPATLQGNGEERRCGCSCRECCQSVPAW